MCLNILSQTSDFLRLAMLDMRTHVYFEELNIQIKGKGTKYTH